MIFAEKHITNESWLLDKLGENKLLKLSRERLDKPFSKGEVASIMEGLASHKQAGPSRVPSGLFKMMSKTFAEPFGLGQANFQSTFWKETSPCSTRKEIDASQGIIGQLLY
jgi:hypothetical protein